MLFIVLFAFGMNVKAQITLEHKYDSASDYLNSELRIINFDVSGERYVRINIQGKSIDFFDMNHSFIKSISYANFPQANSTSTILYLSQNLFTTDSKIDFMYFNQGNSNAAYTGIYNEDGALIFSVDSVGPWETSNTPQQMYPIYNTSVGTKMILSNEVNGQAWVYSLPGMLTTNIQEANNNLIAMQKGKVSNPYPNPNTGSTKIDYTLPEEVNQGEIVFYNLQGMEVKRFKVDRTFNTLLISTKDIAAGTYFYQLQTAGESSGGKKMVVIK